jgi:hypothetical protein
VQLSASFNHASVLLCCCILQERVIREHFLRQTPRLLLHAASDGSLTLVLDVPDLSLLDGKVRLWFSFA